MSSFCAAPNEALEMEYSVLPLHMQCNDVAMLQRCLPEMRDRMYYTFHHMLESFVGSNFETMSFPSGLTALQKNYFLTLVQCMGLRVKSTRTEYGSHVCLAKTRSTLRFVRSMFLSERSILRINDILHLLQPNSSFSKLRFDLPIQFSSKTVAVLTCGNPRVPKPAKSNAFEEHRRMLPIFKHRREILEMIQQNTFLVIKGSAGSGKTTQIPQYILEEAEVSKKPVRILVCLPRRVGAVAVCDRVAAERGEKVGHTVGYQIRLESCTSPVETLLNFCTGTVLLRAMTSPGCPLLDSTTHIILDEIHCRDRYQDFLMNCLRDFALTKPHLKFIFLGEDLNIDFVNEYFGGLQQCPQLVVQGRLFPVTTAYLEDILRYSWESFDTSGSTVKSTTHCAYTIGGSLDDHQKYKNAKSYNVDDLIVRVWHNVLESDDCLDDFLHMVRDDEISVDYPHSGCSITMLMVAAGAGKFAYVDRLLEAGANISLQCSNNFMAIDWANLMGQSKMVQYLHMKMKASAQEAERCPNPTKCIVRDYFQKTATNKVDFGLILRLVHMIHLIDTSGGSILIFLPSYEDLNDLKERICYSCKKEPGWSANPFVIHFLHAHIQTGDQRSVFEKPKPGLRKLILSTDIGQSCLTFEDVRFVIDSGRSKEDGHCVRADAETSSKPKKYGWISKAEANQRRDRAGRCDSGVCYRLYTQQCYEEDMSEFIVPEILNAPLLNLCLQSRALLRSEIPIAEFFEFLPTPPPKEDVLNAIKSLKLIGVLHDDEQLTILGIHLLDYSIDPRWAKALLYSVIFKCMDPILTIASYVSYGDAFVHQYNPQCRQIAYSRKFALSDGTLSDHMAILKVFQKWESERAVRGGNLNEFCKHNFVTSSTFDVVYGIRTRLLGQLRASGFVRNKGIHDVKDLNTHADNWAVVKAVLTAGLYPNLCAVNRVHGTMIDCGSCDLNLHPSSVLAIEKSEWYKGIPSEWIIFSNKCRGPKGSVSVQGCTVVNPVTVALVAGEFGAQPTCTPLPTAPLVDGSRFKFTASDRNACGHESSKYRLTIDNWISMFSFRHNIMDVVTLRENLQSMILRRLIKPELFPSQVDKSLLEAVVYVLSEEDARIGLKQSSVGQWPKLVSGNLLSAPRTGFEVSH